MHNLLDPVRLMSMQEDARLRKISTEVVKRSLYKSVTAPCRRRMMNRMSYCGSSSRRNDDSLSVSVNNGSSNKSYSRMFQSLPVTPLQSLAASPSHSPTGNKHFFYEFLSRGATPRCTTPEPEENDDVIEEYGSDCKGLATLFRPQPRYVSAKDHTFAVDGGALNHIDQNEESFDLVSVGNLAPARMSVIHRTSVDAKQRNNILIKTSSPVFSNTPVWILTHPLVVCIALSVRQVRSFFFYVVNC